MAPAFHTKGALIPVEGGLDPVQFEWNPQQVQGPTARTVWAQINCAGGFAPFLQFSHKEQSNIQFELKFSRNIHDWNFVNQQWRKLEAMTEPVVPLSSVNRPPRVRFVLGDFLWETVVVTEVRPMFDKVFEPLTLLPKFSSISITLWRYYH